MVKMHVRARETITLLVRLQSTSNGGKNKDKIGSKSTPKLDAATPTRSMAAPDSLVRSEFIELIMGRENSRIIGINSAGETDASLRHKSARSEML